MALNSGQQAAFDAIKTGKNIFLTGPAGSGKTHLIRTVMEWATASNVSLAITAMTGCAALLLGMKAKTLHSWAGIGLARESADVLAATILKKPTVKRRWKYTRILIVDEVSMMQPELLEKLDAIGRKVRARSEPFGGLQVVLCGDYFQLPPVTKGMSGESITPGRFAFESPVWVAANLVPVVLSKIERQADPMFQTILNECRIGAPSESTVAALKSRQGLNWKSLAIRPTLLFSRNEDVDTVNVKNVAALNQPLYTYDVKTVIITDPENPVEVPRGEDLDWVVRKLDADANYMPHLELCVGCQVMLLKNQDVELGLVNGSRGVVVGFTPFREPIVQFLRGNPIIIGPHNWQSNECPAVHRSQLPLRVAYAITIHKSQGVTLDCALVDIGSSTFEFGQAYVALSRVRDLESLYVWNLDASKIRAHPAVVRFYERLPAVVTESAPEHASEHAPEHAPEHASKPVSQSTLIPRDLDAAWMRVLDGWTDTLTGRDCMARVVERQAITQVYPVTEDIFAALRHGSPSDVRVVLLGQDPYHGPGQAHGLSFSVQPGIALPPSLRNIRKEYLTDCGGNDTTWSPSVGTLTPWARQGVLLLNSVLTVEAGNPNSHAGIGWEDLTQKLLAAVVEARANQPLVFVAWGRHAQTIVHKLHLGMSHTIIESAHPSPLSAHHGFFGSKPFTRVNAYLTAAGQTPIQWALPAPSQM